jgi:hypothetical protein
MNGDASRVISKNPTNARFDLSTTAHFDGVAIKAARIDVSEIRLHAQKNGASPRGGLAPIITHC